MHIVFVLIAIILGISLPIALTMIIYNFNKIKNVDVNLNFDKNKAYEKVKEQLKIGNRIPGTQERVNCGIYFITEFQKIDANFKYILHNFTTHSTDCQNVLFKLNEKKDNIVILGAHYDSRAKATKDRSHPNDPVPGANDGASGSAVLIELARVFYERKDNLDCQIWFVFFDAEDQGKDEGGYGMEDWDWCEGSEEFVKDINDFYDSDEEDLDCMILLDMVGGNKLQFIYEQHSTSSLLDELFQIGRQLGYTDTFPLFPDMASITDDHIAFINIGIPSADLIINFWNNPNWPYHHTKDDDLSHISKKSLKITGKTLEQFIYNNYLDDLKNLYQGNKPWNDNLNLLYAEIMIIFSIIMATIIGIIVFIYFTLRRLFKKEQAVVFSKS
ncbi:MAG: M28 family peptidase [Promethearchaeota archaeon]